MLLDFDLIYAACHGDLNNPEHWEHVRKLFEPAEDAQLDALCSFLKNLPSAEDQIAIVTQLMRAAEQRGARLGTFKWWDICPGAHRYLFATLRKGGKDTLLSFVWRQKSGQSPMAAAPAATWVTDQAAPEGQRFEIECHSFREVIRAFEDWLTAPRGGVPCESSSML